MLFVTNGLVIRSTDYKESDKILTVLTDAHGKLTVSARGARQRSSRITPAVQLFAYSELTLFENKGRFSLNDAGTKELFSGIGKDIEKMALGSYFAELLDCEQEQNRINPDILRLALNCLYALSKGGYDERRVKAAFELRFVSLCGYAPDLRHCSVCGKQVQTPVIDGRAGKLRCFECQKIFEENVYPISEAALSAARYIIECPLPRLLSFSLPCTDMALLSRFCEGYAALKLERRFKTLDFYSSLIHTG